MKSLNSVFSILLMLTCMLCGCNNAVRVAPDISDLEITPERITVFLDRREDLLSKIDTGIILLNSRPVSFDGGRHRSKAEPNFYFLTALEEKNCILELMKGDHHGGIIYYPRYSQYYRTFVGEPTAADSLMKKFLIAEVREFNLVNNEISEAIKSGIPIYVDFNDIELKDEIFNLMQKEGKDISLLRNIEPLISEMRVRKEPSEIERIQKAIDITGNALLQVYKKCSPGDYEFEIEAIIESSFIQQGAAMPGFASIIASGKNSTIQHYERNDKRMEAGELLLMDIGAEYGYYTSDITRTIPVNGKFSPEQKEIYELVLNAQKAAVSEMIPGNYINSGHFKAFEIIIDGLEKMGLITDRSKEWQRKFYILYPASHFLGMDCHDSGDYGHPMKVFFDNCANDSITGRKLEEGMVLTIEPGVYFRENGLEQLYDFFGNEASKAEIDSFIVKVRPVYEKYKKIEVRIEDDILITEKGNVNLSESIPKEIDQIERLMSL